MINNQIQEIHQHLSIARSQLERAKELAYGIDLTTATRLVVRIDDIDKLDSYIEWKFKS